MIEAFNLSSNLKNKMFSFFFSLEDIEKKDKNVYIYFPLSETLVYYTHIYAYLSKNGHACVIAVKQQ